MNSTKLNLRGQCSLMPFDGHVVLRRIRLGQEDSFSLSFESNCKKELCYSTVKEQKYLFNQSGI